MRKPQPQFNLFDIVYVSHPDIQIGIIVGIQYTPKLEDVRDDPFNYSVLVGIDQYRTYGSISLCSSNLDFDQFFGTEVEKKRDYLLSKKNMLERYGVDFFKDDEDVIF